MLTTVAIFPARSPPCGGRVLTAAGTASRPTHVRQLSRLPESLAAAQPWMLALAAIAPAHVYDAAYLKFAVDLKAPLVTLRPCAAMRPPQRHHTPTPRGSDLTMQHDKILILDFGSQVTQLIARRVREAHVYCEVHPCDVSDDWVARVRSDGALKGVILSGSHASVYEDDDRQGAAGGVRAGRAGAGHLLRHADHGAPARRQGRGRPQARVRLCGGACARPHRAAATTSPTSPRPKATACSTCG